jgi:hypothetical protein
LTYVIAAGAAVLAEALLDDPALFWAALTTALGRWVIGP